MLEALTRKLIAVQQQRTGRSHEQHVTDFLGSMIPEMIALGWHNSENPKFRAVLNACHGLKESWAVEQVDAAGPDQSHESETYRFTPPILSKL